MSPLDALTAMVMVLQADPDDVLFLRFSPNQRSPVWRCTTHAEETAHRMRHGPRNGNKEPPDFVGRVIARDDMADFLKTQRWSLFEIQRTPPLHDSKCARCRRGNR